MLYCYGELEDVRKRQKRNFIITKSKIERKINALKMLINDAKVSDGQKNDLREFISIKIKEV